MRKTLLLTLLLASASANATITIQGYFGTLLTANNSAVPDGTLFALVADSDSSNSFAGIGNLNSAIPSSDAANAAFTAGQTLTVGGTLGGDTIFALGTVNSAISGALGTAAPVITLPLNQNGVFAARNYALYWFPGASYGGGNTATIGTQVGGIHSTGTPVFDVNGMTIPPDGATVFQGFATTDQGGNVNPANVHAWVIPEPSAALLGVLGAVGLIRRKR